MKLKLTSIDQFRAWMADEGLAASTVVRYAGLAVKFMREFPDDEPGDASPKALRMFVSKACPSQSAKIAARAAITKFLKFLGVKGDPFDGWQPKAARHQEKVGRIEADEIMALKISSRITDRQRALVWLLSETGARINAVSQMRPNDVTLQDDGSGVARIIQDKAGQHMVLSHPISANCVKAIEKFRATAADQDWLWGGSRPNTVPPPVARSLELYIKAAATSVFGRDSEQAKRINCHAFRYAFADELRRRGVDIHIIQKILGHADVATTARYFQSSNTEIFSVHKAALRGAYQGDAPQLDRAALEMNRHGRHSLWMWGRDPISGKELGPIHLMDFPDLETAKELWEDWVENQIIDGRDVVTERLEDATRAQIRNNDIGRTLKKWRRK